MKLIFIILLLLFCSKIQAQNILISTDGGSIDESAMLEIRSNAGGLLVPRMTKNERLAIVSPATGLLVFQTDVPKAFYYYDGIAWDTLPGVSTSNVFSTSSSNIAVLSEVQAAGVDGGTFTKDIWITRELNTHEGDSSFITLDNANNTFSLQDGIYEIESIAPNLGVLVNQTRLVNSSLSTIAAIGTASRSSGASSSSIILSIIEVNGGPYDFLIEHRCTRTNTNNGFGSANAWGENVYTTVKIKKLDF